VLKNPRFWLGTLLIWVCTYQGVIGYWALDDLSNGHSKPALPLSFGLRLRVVSGVTDEAQEAGVRSGDVLETVDGKPFSNVTILYDAVRGRKPGDLLPLTVRSPKGTQFNTAVPIPPVASSTPTQLDWVGQILLTIGLPVFCLALGFWVAFQRPNDRIALAGFNDWVCRVAAGLSPLE
jgi:hypothetical protein